MMTHAIARRLLEKPDLDLAAGLGNEAAIGVANHVLAGVGTELDVDAVLCNAGQGIATLLELRMARRNGIVPGHPDHHGGTPEIHPSAVI